MLRPTLTSVLTVAALMAIVQSAREHFAQLQRDTRGWATANGLTALVEAMGNAEGRRAVVLFSEALFRTEANEAQGHPAEASLGPSRSTDERGVQCGFT